jgi:hypothetical protein
MRTAFCTVVFIIAQAEHKFKTDSIWQGNAGEQAKKGILQGALPLSYETTYVVSTGIEPAASMFPKYPFSTLPAFCFACYFVWKRVGERSDTACFRVKK